MIELYRSPSDRAGLEVEETLKQLVVAHRVIVLDLSQPPVPLPSDTSLPALKDKDEIITGSTNIATYLKELEQFISDWRKFQSDACFIDEDGKVC